MVKVYRFKTLTVPNSDHKPILVMGREETASLQQAMKYNFKKADSNTYKKKHIKIVIHGPLNSIEDNDQAEGHSATQSTTPLNPASPNRHTHAFLATTTERHQTVNSWWKHSKRTVAKVAYANLQKKFNLLGEHITHHRCGNCEASAANLKDSSISLWRMNCHRNWEKANPPAQGKSHLDCSKRDKAEKLADTLEASYTPAKASNLTPESEQEVASHLLEYTPETEAANIEGCSRDSVHGLLEGDENVKSGRHQEVIEGLTRPSRFF